MEYPKEDGQIAVDSDSQSDLNAILHLAAI